MNTTATTHTDTRPKELTGTVVSTTMQDTVVVRVQRFEQHPKYRKFIKIAKKYLAHDAGNTCTEGDTVTIRECRPISKRKHFAVVRDTVATASTQ
jgi:small subunit ribosomal protein S17